MSPQEPRDPKQDFIDLVIREGLGDIRPLVAERVEQGAEILAANARDMMRNGENRGSDIMVERGERIASIVIAAQWWAADWRKLDALTAQLDRVREWAAVNEIAVVPLDWAGLGDILNAESPS